MDNLTHSLFALTLAQSPLRKAGRGTTVTLLVASSAPDIDFVSAFVDGSTSYLAAHRGPTHGPLGVLVLAALTTLLVRLAYALFGRREERGKSLRARREAAKKGRPAPLRDDPPSATGLFVAALAGGACHVVMDLPTLYGTRILTPFNTAWFSADWIPIIDVYLLALLGMGLVAAHLRPSARNAIVACVILLMGANYALRGTLHYRALQAAAGGNQAVLAHFNRWPNTPDGKLPAERSCLSGSRQESGPHGCLIDAAALPTFLSPFHWRLIRVYANGYALNEIDLRGRPLPVDERWYPSTGGPAVTAAARARPADVLLRFARFPAAQMLEPANGPVVVRFDEVRFLGGPGPLSDESEPRVLFRVVVPLEGNGRPAPERVDR